MKARLELWCWAERRFQDALNEARVTERELADGPRAFGPMGKWSALNLYFNDYPGTWWWWREKRDRLRKTLNALHAGIGALSEGREP